ncbi:MAG: flippase [Anaerolineales bacterium]|nr:flippase [Anaerolineales bacterium]
MNQPRQIFKNTVALGLAELINRIGGFVIVFFIARKFQASGLGTYSAAIEFYGIILLAGGMGVMNFLVREIAKDPSRTNNYILHISVAVTAVSVVVGILAYILVPYLGYSGELAASVFVIIFAVLPGAINLVQRAVFVAHQRVEFVTYTRLISTFANIAISLFLLLRDFGIVSLIIVFVVIEYINMLLYFYYINRSIVVLHWEFDPHYARLLLGELKVFATLSIMAGLFARPEILILSVVQNEAQIGYYSAALKIALLWEIISNVYMTNVFPVLSRSHGMEDDKSQLVQDKSIKYLLALSLPLAIGMTAISAPIILFIFGPGFEVSEPVLQILAWSVPLIFINDVFWRVLIARGQQDLVLQIRVITLLIRLGSGFLLISLWGAIGAAIAMVSNMFLNDLLLGIYIRREGLQLNLLHAGGRFAIAAATMGILTWLLGRHIHLLFLVPIAIFVYAILSLSLRAFTAEDFNLLGQVFRPQVARRST